ncbi:MAG: hypothetical protein EBV03_00270 [Proteobacteria bacterium]|nr:hypothetical protein [Pseudomonadota bacterium]
MKHRFKQVLLSLLALLLLVEEWLWDVLTLLGHVLARRLHLQRFEAWLAQAPRQLALLAFLIPLFIVTPLNLFAFWMIAKGMVLRGVMLEIFAKLLGTLLVARVFALTRAQLLTYGWFSSLYTTIMRWLHWAHARLSATLAYALAKALKAQARQWWSQWRARFRDYLR